MPVEKKDFRLDDGAENAKNRNNPVPPIYVYVTPGVMIPFLGSGQEGAEKGVKLAAAGECPRLVDFAGIMILMMTQNDVENDFPSNSWH